MSLVFALDTTSKNCSLSVCQEERILGQYNFSSGKPLSSALLPDIEFILGDLELTIGDIDVWAICTGPGLFTGIRIGLSTLKGLLFGETKPVVSVNSLEAVARAAESKGPEIVSLIDARRGEVYMAVYSGTGGEKLSAEVLKPQITNVEELPSVLESGKSYVFTGSGAEFHRESIRKMFQNSRFSESAGFLSYAVSQLGLEKFRKGEYSSGVDNILPLYIRRPDAEKNIR